MVAIIGTSNQCWNEVLALCWLKYVAGLATCVGMVLAVLEICNVLPVLSFSTPDCRPVAWRGRLCGV